MNYQKGTSGWKISGLYCNCISQIIYINIIAMSEYFRKYIKKDYFPVQSANIKFKTFFTNCIPAVLSKRNYKQTEEDDWDIYWCEKEFLVETLDKIRLFPNKRVNHFRNWYEICRKDLLSKNVKKYKRALEKQGKTEEAASYNYMPLTYNLPSEYPIFLEEFKKASKDKSIWIMKPIGKSQGKGIFLFQKLNQISEWADQTTSPEPYIVQRYIYDPLLIGNKKFDLRIYVLVTSHNPLTIYLYRSGFARFTHYRYEMNDITSLESHITNVAFQKNSDNYDEQKGGKYQLDKLRLYMLSKYGNDPVQQCFFNIQQLVIKTLTATAKLMMNDKRCFELYGFDVLIDSQLKPWLVEVNGSPSMTASTAVDGVLKMSLLDDTLTVVNLEGLLTGDEEQVGGFDIIYRNNKRIKYMSRNVSLLGCFNDRDQKMRKMAKNTALRLAQKSKQSAPTTIAGNTAATNTRGKTTTTTTIGTAANSLYAKTRVANSTGTPGSNPSNNNTTNHGEAVKFPKVTNSSNKNIEATKKPENAFRIVNSRDKTRIQI